MYLIQQPCPQTAPFVHDLDVAGSVRLKRDQPMPSASAEVRTKLQRLLSSALGGSVFVTDSAGPVGGKAAAAGANCFWVECFADEHEGELRQVAGGSRPPGRGPTELLCLGVSARESEVLFWVAQGKTNPEIAVILGIGRRTAATHVEHILAKLGVENRCAAARCASEVLFG